ncbi:phosphotransferase [Streptomyces sp. FXJ1.4098]|nr:phosphotransferase [Streptomyces sp. FXJ1.4098]
MGRTAWLASEFLPGLTLTRAVDRFGPFAEADVRALGAALAGTLAEIHTAGLVHRDLKPSNVVLTRGGPYIIDFGIARPEHGMTLTGAGSAPATPGFSAPSRRSAGAPGHPAMSSRWAPCSRSPPSGACRSATVTRRPSSSAPFMRSRTWRAYRGPCWGW